MKLVFKINETLEDGKTYKAEVLHITPYQPSPYPDNTFIEYEGEELQPDFACINNTPKYWVNVKATAVKDADNNQVLASHPDPAKNNTVPLFTFELVGNIHEKTDTEITEDARYKAEKDKNKKEQYALTVDCYTLEHYRKTILGTATQQELDEIKAKIQTASGAIQSIQVKKK